MMRPVGGPGSPRPTPINEGLHEARTATGAFAGKPVKSGGALKTAGRVALGVVTLGVSELVIRLARRKTPELVPTTGPGRAARMLDADHAAPDGADRAAAKPARMSRHEIAAAQEDMLRHVLGQDQLGRSWYDRYHTAAQQRVGDWLADPANRGAPNYAAVKKLTGPELVAVFAYTHLSYKDINAQLRAGGEMEPNAAAIATVLDSALAKLPPYEGNVHRGADLHSPEQRARYARGNEVTEAAYTSTSRNFGQAFKGNTQWSIMSRTGRDVSFCSAIPKEQEILFPSNTRFKVLHNEKIGAETLVVMKEVSD